MNQAIKGRSIRLLTTNPIIRRVRRHAAVATLFRSMPPLPSRGLAQRSMVSSSRVVSGPAGNLVVASPGPAVAPLPTSLAVGPPAVMREAVAPLELPVPQTSAEMVRLPPSPVPVREAQRKPEPPPEEPGTTDREWRRLQTILKRHEEEQTVEQTPPGTEEHAAAAPQGSTAPPISRPQPRAATSVAPEPQPGAAASAGLSRPEVPRTTEAPAQSLPAPDAAPRVARQRVQRTVQERETPRPVTRRAVPPPSQPQEKPQPRPQAEAPEKPLPEPQTEAPEVPAGGAETVAATPRPVSRMAQKADQAASRAPLPVKPESSVLVPAEAAETSEPAAAATQEKSASEHTATGRRSYGVAPGEGLEAYGSLDASAEGQPMPSALPVQAVPLSEVWGVQRIVKPASSATDLQAEGTELAPPASAAEPVSSEPAQPEQVQRILRDALPGQPTESSIEIVTPRRPRPQPAPPGDQALEQRKEAVDAAQTRAEESAPSAPVQRPPEVQAESSAAQPSAEVIERDLVETEVGPLPADLWHLLGQTPPGPSPAQTAPPKLMPSPTQRDAGVMRAIEAAEASPASPAPPILPKTSPEVVPTIIQRETKEDAVGPVHPGPKEAEPSQEDALTALDTDELARRVLAEIRRRLAVEWDRVRRQI